MAWTMHWRVGDRLRCAWPAAIPRGFA